MGCTCKICNNYRLEKLFNLKERILGEEVIYPICNSCEGNTFNDDVWRKEQIERIHENSLMYAGFLETYKKYNITKEKFIELFKKQKGSCKICGKHASELKRSLAIDHCHTTSKVRGLLCNKCNLMLGLSNDDIKILRKAVIYLNESVGIVKDIKIDDSKIKEIEEELLKKYNN